MTTEETIRAAVDAYARQDLDAALPPSTDSVKDSKINALHEFQDAAEIATARSLA